jgi:hypothetical protein
MSKLADENKNGVSDGLENTAPLIVTTRLDSHAPPLIQNAPTTSLGPLIVVGIVVIGLAVIVAIFVFLLLNKG